MLGRITRQRILYGRLSRPTDSGNRKEKSHVFHIPKTGSVGKRRNAPKASSVDWGPVYKRLTPRPRAVRHTRI